MYKSEIEFDNSYKLISIFDNFNPIFKSLSSFSNDIFKNCE